MEKSLSLSEKLFCLAVRPQSGGIFIGASSSLTITLTGCVFVELMNLGLISLNEKLVHVNRPTVQNNPIYEFFLKPIRDREKDRKLRNWISVFNTKGRKIQKLFIRELVRKGVLLTEEKRIFFIPYEKVYLKDQRLVESIRNEVFQAALGKIESDEEMLILTIMANKANILPQIIPDRAQRKEARKRIKAIPETKMTKSVQEAIEMVNTAMIILAT